jgi:hypothetical protein
MVIVIGVGTLIAAIAVLYYYVAEGNPRKFKRLLEEGVQTSSDVGTALSTPFKQVGNAWRVSDTCERSPPTSSFRSYYLGSAERGSSPTRSPTRSPIKIRLRNIDDDLAEEASIKGSARSSRSSRSPPTSFNSLAPRRFKSYGSVDCALLAACSCCVCIFLAAMTMLVLLLPLPDWFWEDPMGQRLNAVRKALLWWRQIR